VGSLAQSDPHATVLLPASVVVLPESGGGGLMPPEMLLYPLSQSFVQSSGVPGGCESSVLQAAATTQRKPARHVACRDMP